MSEQPIGVMTISSSETELGFPLQTNVRVDESVEKKKKKSVNILKVALMLLRRRSRKSKNNPAVDVASKAGMWNRLVGAMRPLQLQSDQSPPTLQVVPSLPATSEPAPPLLHSSPSVDRFEDVSSSSSSVDGMSRYASAVNLQDMDKNDEEENNDKVFDNNTNGEDEMIDVKAEMFIAQFYAQMRLQRSNSDVRYNEMIKRSIG